MKEEASKHPGPIERVFWAEANSQFSVAMLRICKEIDKELAMLKPKGEDDPAQDIIDMLTAGGMGEEEAKDIWLQMGCGLEEAKAVRDAMKFVCDDAIAETVFGEGEG